MSDFKLGVNVRNSVHVIKSNEICILYIRWLYSLLQLANQVCKVLKSHKKRKSIPLSETNKACDFPCTTLFILHHTFIIKTKINYFKNLIHEIDSHIVINYFDNFTVGLCLLLIQQENMRYHVTKLMDDIYDRTSHIFKY